MIKTREKSWTQRFDDSMLSCSSEKKPFFFHLKMMTWSHRNVVSKSSRLFLSLDVFLFYFEINENSKKKEIIKVLL